MTPEISEFSYGFALTNELVGWTPLHAAPVFPSLIEEGRAGGGYDVQLDLPGVALFLQFKRAECLVRRSAKEIKGGANLIVPFYRFALMDPQKSDQHQLLRRLDNGSNAVFYAAPRFHTLAEINVAWTTNSVAARSVFIAPNAIGPLTAGKHSIAYDDYDAFRCSEPKEVHFLDAHGLLDHLKQRIEKEKLPMSTQLPRLANEIEAIAANRELIDETLEADREPALIDTRSPRQLSEAKSQLRRIADAAAEVFGTQLTIVQPHRPANEANPSSR